MFLPLPATVLAMTFMIHAAEQVPKFDLNPVCGSNDADACFRGETQARDALAQQWAQFRAADRTRCVQLTIMSKMPSYVQVITCLEMAQNARQQSPDEQTPSSSQSDKKPTRR